MSGARQVMENANVRAKLREGGRVKKKREEVGEFFQVRL